MFVGYHSLSSALQLDVAPTIVDRLGLPVPSSWQGKSLLRAEPHTTSFHQAGFQPQHALIHREGPKVWKYIFNTKTQAEELYELYSDPQEERNLVQTKEASAILPRLRTLLQQQ